MDGETGRLNDRERQRCRDGEKQREREKESGEWGQQSSKSDFEQIS